LHLIITRQTRAADPDFLLFDQYRVEMPVAGEFSAAGTDAAAADRTL